jgi:hypothetical protein
VETKPILASTVKVPASLVVEAGSPAIHGKQFTSVLLHLDLLLTGTRMEKN